MPVADTEIGGPRAGPETGGPRSQGRAEARRFIPLRATSIIPHYRAARPPPLETKVSFQPGSIDRAHKADEFVELDQLESCAAFLRRLAPRAAQ